MVNIIQTIEIQIQYAHFVSLKSLQNADQVFNCVYLDRQDVKT